jgi:hypothetical protein
MENLLMERSKVMEQDISRIPVAGKHSMAFGEG